MNGCFNMIGEATKRTGLDFSYTGTRTEVSGEPNADWEFSLLSTGKLLFKKNPGLIDVCIVGAGGAGNGPGGAGGGYVKNLFGVEVTKGVEYEIIIGLGAEVGSSEGGASTAFGETAPGGKSSTEDRNGADGGNGGGGGAPYGSYNDRNAGGNGGNDGENGTGGDSYYYDHTGGGGITSLHNTSGGIGQKALGLGTTRAFGESDGERLAGGGAGAGELTNGTPGAKGGAVGEDGEENSGGGGGGDGGKGGHGLVIIRNHREVAA